MPAFVMPSGASFGIVPLSRCNGEAQKDQETPNGSLHPSEHAESS